VKAREFRSHSELKRLRSGLAGLSRKVLMVNPSSFRKVGRLSSGFSMIKDNLSGMASNFTRTVIDTKAPLRKVRGMVPEPTSSENLYPYDLLVLTGPGTMVNGKTA
jgi:hypothetical protein